MTIEEKNDLVEILNMEIRRCEDKARTGKISVEQKNHCINELNKVVVMISSLPESEESYKEKGRQEYADKLIEVIKEYRDTGRKYDRLDSSEEYNCNRIKYFAERLRDTWDEPAKQVFI